MSQTRQNYVNNNSGSVTSQEQQIIDEFNVEKSIKSDRNSQNQSQDPIYYQQSDLLQFTKKSPKAQQHTLDLLEYQACRSKRLLEESSQFQAQQSSLMGGGSIHQKLYEESVILKEKENQRNNIKSKQIKEYSEDSKMNQKTYKVLIKQLENNLTNFISQIVGEQKQMTFEQLGRLLTMLQIFRVLFYDTNCQFKDQQAINNDESQMQNKRKFQEMVLHERLWSLLSGTEQSENIQNQLVWCVLRILLDHSKISMGQRVNIIREYLQRFNNNNGNYEEIEDFIKYWGELKIDQMCYKKIGYLKKNKFEEYLQYQSSTLTFKPKINEVNYLLESHSTAKFLEKHPIDGIDSQFYQSLNKDYEQQFYSKSLNAEYDKQGWSKISVQSPQNSLDRVKLLYKKQELRDQQIYEQQMDQQDKEVQNCTFKPDVSINKKVNEWSVISKYGQTGIYDRLYNLNPIIEREVKHNSKIIEDQQKELQQCSFTPQINRGIYTNEILNKLEGRDFVKGYDKTVGRLRFGMQEKQKLSQQLSHIPAGENLEKERKKVVNPPSLLTRQKKAKKNPFYVIEVAMRPGKNGKISLYPGDDPFKVTENFAKSFSITGENKSKLFLKVKYQIDQYNARIQQKIEYDNSIDPQLQQLQHQYERKQLEQQLQQQQIELQQQELYRSNNSQDQQKNSQISDQDISKQQQQQEIQEVYDEEEENEENYQNHQQQLYQLQQEYMQQQQLLHQHQQQYKDAQQLQQQQQQQQQDQQQYQQQQQQQEDQQYQNEQNTVESQPIQQEQQNQHFQQQQDHDNDNNNNNNVEEEYSYNQTHFKQQQQQQQQ